MEEYERAREQIARTIRDNVMSLAVSSHPHTSERVADEILSLVEIRADDQSLPENSYHPNPLREYDHQITEAGMIGYGEAQLDMLKAGFIRVIPKPKRK